MAKQFSAQELQALSQRIFQCAGWEETWARECAEHLVLANLSGHDSHGVGMIPIYINAWAAGLLKPESRPVVRNGNAPFLVIDAQISLGQPAANIAVRQAISMAKTGGIAVLNLINAHHIGRIGHYAEMTAAEGLVSMFWVNVAGRPPIVAPFGAREARFGTNPHTIGVPDGDLPLILDFATSRMAQGKARVALNQGAHVAEGYLIDHAGRPSTDPAVVFDAPLGALLPFGDHKGAGIALMAEVLAAALGGGATMPEAPAKAWVLNNMFAVIFDPARLDPDDAGRGRRTRLIADFQRSAAPQPGADKVRSPGDREREVRAERGKNGIPVDDGTWALILEAASKTGADVQNIQ